MGALAEVGIWGGGGERVESSLIKISSGNVYKRKKITKFVTITSR